MKTRNSTSPKTAAAKKTPPSRKSSAKKTPPIGLEIESTTPITTEINLASASTVKIVKTDDTTPSASVDLKPQQPVEQAKTSADTVEVTPETKVGTGAKTTRKVVVRKTPARTKTPPSAKTVPRKTPKSQQTEKLNAGESSEKEEVVDANDVDSLTIEESSISIVEESVKKEEPSVENVEAAKRVEEQNVMIGEELSREKQDIIGFEKLSTVDLKVKQSVEQETASAEAVEEPESKVGTGAKTTRKVVVKKTPARTKTPTSAKTVPGKMLKSEKTEKLKAGESSGKEEVGDANNVDFLMKEESYISITEESVKKEEPSVENVEEAKMVEYQNIMNGEGPPQEKEDIIGVEKLSAVDLKAEQPVEQEKASADAVEETPESKLGTGAKTTRKVVVKKTRAGTKTSTSAKAVPKNASKSEQATNFKVGESSKNKEGGDAMDVDSAKKEESSISNADKPAKKVEPFVENVEDTKMVEDQNVMIGEKPPQQKEDIIGVEKLSSVNLKAEQPIEQEKASADAVEVTPELKVSTGPKTTRKVVVKKTPSGTKTRTSAKAVPKNTPKSEQTAKFKVGESSKKEEGGNAVDVDSAKKEESSISNVDKPAKKGDPFVENVEDTKMVEDQNATVIDTPQEKEEIIDVEQHLVHVGKSPRLEDPVTVDFVEVSASQEPGIPREEEEVKNEMREETSIIEDDVGSENEPVNMEEIHKLTGEDTTCENEGHDNEQIEQCRDQEVLEEFWEEEFATQDIPEHGEKAEALEEENKELNAVVKERKMRKELEIFVGGFDRDAVEEDVKKAFENTGDVVEVRLHRNTSIDKNKGYAFVKFATKEQASRALSEIKDPLICGKRCRTGPSEDNDSLFVGNICNTWTEEAIKQKLEEYGVEGVQNITLVADARHEGLSRGFAFVGFSCHADATLAYKRLQKPDAIFGHAERSAKVAFAEPLREPDPEVMAQVKSVFIDGVHPNLDEDQVREQMEGYGEIARIMLARNMPTAKRRDFGFVDFTTHEAAVACVEGINDKNLGDGNSKTKVKARLSNPLPKTQAIKGGMCGGFRIGRSGAGRGFGRGAHAFNRPNFHRDRNFYQRGNVPTWRMGFPREHDLDIPYPPFHRREISGRGGWRDSFRGAQDAPRGSAVPARPNFEGGRQNAPVRGRGMPIPTRRQPFPHGEGFNRTFGERQFDDPYFYVGHAHGTKRPLFMADQDADYVERSRQRPRWDYSDPAVQYYTPHNQDSFGARSSRNSHDYYGAEYGEGSYSSFYGNDRPYGGGYYY